MDYIEYIKPELLILIPALMIAGGFLKQSAVIKDKHIPSILGICGVILSCLWVMGNGFDSIFTAIFTAVMQGILCAGASVYGNQLYKQHIKDRDGEGE